MIRHASGADFEELLGMAERFLAATSIDVPFHREHITNVLKVLMSDPTRVVLIAPGKGMLWGILVPMWFDPSVLVATELAWWVEPHARNGGTGIRLLRRFEEWAERVGARRVEMATVELAGQGMLDDAFFGSLGYTPVQRNYHKVLDPWLSRQAQLSSSQP